VSKTQAERASKIDAMMEQASRALVDRDYFAAERIAASALRRAHHGADYDRMARILLPLQEARRMKREMAVDTGRITLVEADLPEGRAFTAGCYLVGPPRVGADGRLLRDMADERGIPAFILVREPPTRDGLWPIVAVGPVTVRAKIEPPDLSPPAPAPAKPAGKRPAKASAAGKPQPVPMAWFIHAAEQLGDEAISQVPLTLPAAARVDALVDRLEAVPLHEKLHQRLEEACREALQEPPRRRKPGMFDPFDDDLGDAD
jgi:hypothetical protein